jgi:hypothetical protein
MKRIVTLVLGLTVGLGVTAARPMVPGGGTYCSKKHARSVVHDFIRAYNDGNLRKLDRLFVSGDDFGWYRVGSSERAYPFSEDRSTLIDYFAGRHELGDEMRLTELRFSGRRGTVPENVWGFGFTLERTSSAVAPWGSGTFEGKGGVDCFLYGWNMSW